MDQKANYKILLDLDGVLVDFVGGICHAHNKENPYLQQENLGCWYIEDMLHIPRIEFWQPAHEIDFWKNLEPMPDFESVLQLLTEIFGYENICLLSSPCLGQGVLPGKIAWLEKFMPQYARDRRFLFGARKEFCAGTKNHILIDDYDKNINNFREHGGSTLLVPRLWNSLHEQSYRTVEYLKEELSTWK